MGKLSIVAALGLAVVACKDKGTGKGKGGDKQEPENGPVALPQVAAEATMLPDEPLEMLVLADAGGTLRINAAPDSWAKLSTVDLLRGAKQVDARTAHYAINEARALGVEGERFMKDWNDGPTDMMLPPDDRDVDDPPPPEPEDEEEEEEEESGGTGTAMTLEEGKMGKKDSDRAEGQYKMVKADPELVRAKKRGSCGAFASLAADDPGATEPGRMCAVAGDVITEGNVRAYSMLLAAPAAKAAPLIDILDETELIGVGAGGKVRALRLAFQHRRDHIIVDPRDQRWIEVRIWPVGLDIEAVPDAPQAVAWTSGALDGKAVAAAYDKALAARGLDKDYPVDVLVSPDVDMQHLVEVLVALDQAGARVIGLGLVPAKGARQAVLRGHRIPKAALRVEAVGDIDRRAVADVLAAEQAKVAGCYETLLATKPDAAGELTVTFTFDKKGTAKGTVAKGIDPTLETCVSGVFARVKFPAPTTGTVQGIATYTMSN